MTEAPPPLPESVPGPTRDLVFRLLEKDPDARPKTAGELCALLDALETPAQAPARADSLPSARADTAYAKTRIAEPPRAREWAREMIARAAPHAERLARFSRQRLGGRVPIWAVAAGTLLLVLLARAACSSDSAAPAASPAPSASPAPAAKRAPVTPSAKPAVRPPAPDPELRRTIELARLGSVPALAALDQRPDAERTAGEWLARAQGYLHQRKVSESLASFAQALRADPELAGDKTMLAGLRYFADRDSTFEQVLSFAADHLGSVGADLLFHVWASTSRITPSTRRAWELLQTNAVQSHLSEALELTLALRSAKTCEAIKSLMPRIEAAGDERCLIRMRELSKDTGCGPNKKADCYPCLRTDSQFEDALVQVQMRNAPRFNARRRWR